MTKISIAMATYNGARFIQEQLNSFVAQARQPDELVITDDGSTDDTLGIIERFAATAPFCVQVQRNPQRLNYSRNFERAISLCGGDIIFLSDQDDVWFPQKIQTVSAEFLANSKVMVVINNQIVTNAELVHSRRSVLENLERVGRTSDALIWGCCTALRRSWAEQAFPMPPDADSLIAARDLAHDEWIHKLATLLNVRAVVRQPLQFYRRTGTNAAAFIFGDSPTVGMRDLARARVRLPPVSAWQRRLTLLGLYEQHLASHRDLPGDLDVAFRSIAHERSSLEQRIALGKMPLPKRLCAVWRLWRSGGYRYFDRWMSAANDVVRSAAKTNAV